MSRVRLDLRITKLTTDETLKREDGVRRVDDGLTFRGQTDETLSVLRERDDRGCRPRTLGVLNHLRGLPLHNGDAGICCSKVNTDNGTYVHALELLAIVNVACQQTTYH